MALGEVGLGGDFIVLVVVNVSCGRVLGMVVNCWAGWFIGACCVCDWLGFCVVKDALIRFSFETFRIRFFVLATVF